MAVERWTDLMTMPYGIPIKENLRIKEEFKTEPGRDKGKSKISMLVEEHGQTATFKGLGKLGSSLVGKFAFGVSSMVGGINVVGLAGGFAVTKLFDVANDKLQLKKLIEKLKLEIDIFAKNTKFLSERYDLCRKLLTQYINSDSGSDRKIIK